VKDTTVKKRFTIECSHVLFVGDGFKFSTSTHRSVTCRTGKEYGRKQGELIARNLTQQMTRFPIEFSTDVTLYFN
jgi:hypothetical protein